MFKKNNYHVFYIYNVPGTVLNIICVFAHLILINLWHRFFSIPGFKMKDLKLRDKRKIKL